MKKILLTLFCLFFITVFYAQDTDEQEELDINAEELEKFYNEYRDSVEQSFTYAYGKIDLDDGLATLHVPNGYKFLDKNQSKTVLEDLWGNPPSDETIGLLLPEHTTPLSDNFTYAVEIDFAE